MLVVDVLPGTPAAQVGGAEMLTTRRDSMLRRTEDLIQLAPGGRPAPADDARTDTLARDGERNEISYAPSASDPVAGYVDALDLEFDGFGGRRLYRPVYVIFQIRPF